MNEIEDMLTKALESYDRGLEYKENYQYKKAIKFLKKSLKYISIDTDIISIIQNRAIIKSELAETYRVVNDILNAIKIFKTSLDDVEILLQFDYDDIATQLNRTIQHVNIASMYRSQKKYKKSIDYYDKALKYYEIVIEMENNDSLDNLTDMLITNKELAELYIEMNNFKKAEELIAITKNGCNSALEIDESKISIINTLASLDMLRSEIFQFQGKNQLSIEFLYKSIESYHLSLDINPNHTETLNDRTVAKSRLAMMYLRDYTNQDRALDLFEKIIVDFDLVLTLEPHNLYAMQNRGISKTEMAIIYHDRGEGDLALDFFDKAMDDYEIVLEFNPKDIEVLSSLASTHKWISKLYMDRDNFKKAFTFLTKAIDIYHSILEINPHYTKAINHIATSQIDLGKLYLELGKNRKALKLFKSSIKKSKKSFKIDSYSIDPLNNRALALLSIGEIYKIRGEQHRAIKYFKKAIDYHNLVLETRVDDVFTLSSRGIVYDNITEIYVDLKQIEESNKFYKRALDDYDLILRENPNSIDVVVNKVKIVSDYIYNNKKYMSKTEGLEILEQTIVDCDKILDINPTSYDAITNKLSILSDISEIYYDMGDIKKTMSISYQELAEYAKILKIYPNDATTHNNAGVGKLYLAEHLLVQNEEQEALKYLKDAIPNYNSALRVNPQDMETITNKSLTLREIIKLKKDEKFIKDSIDTNYRLLELYDRYFFAIEHEGDTFHLTQKMIYPLSTLVYSFYRSTFRTNRRDYERVLKAIELSKSKTLKQMLSEAIDIDSISFESQRKRDKFLHLKEKLDKLKKEIREMTQVEEHQEPIKEKLYTQLNLYTNKLSNLLFDKELNIDNIYQIALDVLDEDSVVLYPIYYEKKHEISVVALSKREGEISVDIQYERLIESVDFSEYIYFIREIEGLFRLSNKEAIERKIEILNESYLTVDNEILKKIFMVDKKMKIVSLKMSKHDFDHNYKYQIIQKALSFIKNICIRSIPKGIKKIYFSPFGDLNLLPLHAISTESGYLIEQYEIAYIPFLSILSDLKQKEEKGDNLFFSIEEFEKEAIDYNNLMGGNHIPNINSIEFKKIVHNQKYNLLHLSTHGLSDLSNPLNSHLLFKNSQLSLLEIYGLKLDVNLVVLSACETNLSELKGADEVLAFERAFLIAGAKNIITTFSTVNVIRTRDFMEDFYMNIEDEKSISSIFQQTSIEDIKAKSSEWMLFRFTGV